MPPVTRSFRIGVTTITVIAVVAGIGIVNAVASAAECHRLGISTAACINGPCTPAMAPAGCIPATCEQSQGCPGYAAPAAAPTATGSGFNFEQVKPTLQIDIPTFKLSDVRARTVDGTPTDVSIPWIGEYIAALYRWAVPVGAILATVVIMVAGVIWMTSGGAGTLSTAKEWITNAVIGLLLLVGSYVVLNIINPDLVRLQALQVKLILPDALNFEGADHAEDERFSGAAAPGTAPGGRYTSDLNQAKANRSVAIDYSLFGKLDFAAYGQRRIQDVLYIAVHNGGYTAAMNHNTWFDADTKKGKHTAAHYTIQRDGSIFQHVGEELVTTHAEGQNRKGVGIELNIGKYRGTSCNSLHQGKDAINTACTPTDAQYQSLSRLIDDIARRTSARKDVQHVRGHCETSKVPGGHGDPKAFDWSKIGISSQVKLQQLAATPNNCRWYVGMY